MTQKFSNCMNDTACPRSILKYARMFLVGTMTGSSTDGMSKWGPRMITTPKYEGQLYTVLCPSQNANGIPIGKH